MFQPAAGCGWAERNRETHLRAFSVAVVSLGTHDSERFSQSEQGFSGLRSASGKFLTTVTTAGQSRYCKGTPRSPPGQKTPIKGPSLSPASDRLGWQGIPPHTQSRVGPGTASAGFAARRPSCLRVARLRAPLTPKTGCLCELLPAFPSKRAGERIPHKRRFINGEEASRSLAGLGTKPL